MSTTIEDLFDSIEEVASEAVEAQQLLYTVEDELLKLKRENKKLREACKRLVNTARIAEGATDYELLDARFAQELRDLGIEIEVE
jgi:septation ring formation regulator EzrA